ncbi:MAG: alpha-amylase family glycosyl hydrolase [Verrucomicrobiota bacterium]
MTGRGDKAGRMAIYQLLVRTFGNTNETRQRNGTMRDNGCGKFADLNDAALKSIAAMGFNHIWLTGVLEQASGTAYPGRPADDPDILKGIAGSPYAVRDCFDVCPDYADVPERRLEEFRCLLARCKGHGLRPLIDFIPNHVARSYESDVMPTHSFGAEDDVSVFFSRDNHFFYLGPDDAGGGPPLRLPNHAADGFFALEKIHGRVTGNNAATWSPSAYDWYETVKLNYGHDYRQGRDTAHLPRPDANVAEVPRTWWTMDEVIAYWQGFGVAGFRVDMAHMVPMEFWRWLVKRARARDDAVVFVAEAYDGDPAKLTDANVLDELLAAGFDAVYDAPAYKTLAGIYSAGKWANDLDKTTFAGGRFHRSLRYAENHDEVRLANPGQWGGLGMKAGKPVSAVLFAMGRGPLMVYHGQEIGEPALVRAGFGGDGGRTSIFDYWCMPEFAKWVNGGRYDGGKLSNEQRGLRDWYGRLVRLMAEPAFAGGEFYGLNYANRVNPAFGRVSGETHSGHWLYVFLRHDQKSGQTFLVAANFHGSEMLTGIRVVVPEHALRFCAMDAGEWNFTDRLATEWCATAATRHLCTDGLALPGLPPCTAVMLEITRVP